jgi:hypothetical protein
MASVEDEKITVLHNYPNDPIITYKEGTKRKFTYNIIEEGFYPPAEILAYSKRGKKYKIPDEYIVETTWGKPNKTRQTLKCTIKYDQNEPVFRAYYGEKFDKILESRRSCTDVATQYQRVCI